jgi:hypothetical protein
VPAVALEVEPAITLGEIYTSNVNLAPDGQEEDEWITRVVPSIYLGYLGTGLRVDFTYALEALFYASDSERNGVFNQLDLNALLNLIGEDLQLRARGTMTQVNVAPEEPIASSNVNVTGNRTDANSFEIGPEWNTDVFSSSVLDGYAYAGRVTYDDTPRDDDLTDPVEDLVQDIDTLEARISLHSADEAASPITYEAVYEYDNLDYELSGEAEQQAAWLRTGYRFTPEFEVFALGGLDSDFEDLDDSSLSEGRWEVGVDVGSPLARLQAAVGERYWGTTWRALLERVQEESTYRVSYRESPSTTDRTQLQQIPLATPGDDDVLPPPPDTDIERFGDPTRFLQKRADALASWRLSRSTVTLDAFWDRREDQIVLDPEEPQPTTREDETSYGAIASFRLDIGARSRAGVSASWRRREFVDTTADVPFTDVDTVVDGTLSFETDLGALTSLAFSTGLQSRDGAADDDDNYDEYWASAQLTRRF